MTAISARLRHLPACVLHGLRRVAPLLCCGLLLVHSAARGAGADENGRLEYRVKAAFLFYFANFVQWPEQAFAGQQTPFSLCVLGADPFGRVLDETVGGKRVGGRALIVRRLQQPDPPKDCQVLFISRSEDMRLRRVLQGLRDAPILTVSESPDALRLGSMVAFVLEDGRVRFDINLPAAEDASLKVSSKLLGVAHLVER